MVSAVSRTLDILNELNRADSGATGSELVMRLEIGKGVVSRILAALEQDRYVTRDDMSDSFRIGLRFAGIALGYIDPSGIPDLCVSLLQKVAREAGGYTQLAVVQNNELNYVAKAKGNQRIRMLSLLGQAAVLHASSAVKVWLASLQEERALGLVLSQGMPRYTDRTITSIDDFCAELAPVRKNGFATIEGALFEGANAIAVPVRNHRLDRIIGAVVVSGPTYRMSKKWMTSLIPQLKNVADRLNDTGIQFGALEPVNFETKILKRGSSKR